jgi:hypothetical protein
MFQSLRTRIPIRAAVVGLCLALSGCGGSKITKANADKITTGMTEQQVTKILGAPSESSEAEVPDLGAMFGSGGDVPGLPKKAKQAAWKEGEKGVVVTFMDGKVAQTMATGF